LQREPPEASRAGIVLACLSLVVMPLLARAKRRVAAGINSRALKADSVQTDVCTYLSAILLGGLTATPYSACGGLTPWRRSP
jgi:divalent metal cation (Fe/Co/Zn/Cd) transporter